MASRAEKLLAATADEGEPCIVPEVTGMWWRRKEAAAITASTSCAPDSPQLKTFRPQELQPQKSHNSGNAPPCCNCWCHTSCSLACSSWPCCWCCSLIAFRERPRRAPTTTWLQACSRATSACQMVCKTEALSSVRVSCHIWTGLGANSRVAGLRTTVRRTRTVYISSYKRFAYIFRFIGILLP